MNRAASEFKARCVRAVRAPCMRRDSAPYVCVPYVHVPCVPRMCACVRAAFEMTTAHPSRQHIVARPPARPQTIIEDPLMRNSAILVFANKQDLVRAAHRGGEGAACER